MWESLLAALPMATWLLGILISVLVSGHVVLHKESTRSAAGWMGLVWLAPFIGALLYLLLGVNRIRRKAVALRKDISAGDSRGAEDPFAVRGPSELPEPALGGLMAAVDQVADRPLVQGNAVDVLVDGDMAYPAMLRAIQEAERSITLCTYIFDDDAWGRRFAGALGNAVDRGVAVRVLMDGIGTLGLRTISRHLRSRRVPHARFLCSPLPWRMAYVNLRNHRKILVVDGHIGFTGGMNIRKGHVVGEEPRAPVRDLHFRLEGPVVHQLQHMFALDWAFTTGEQLEGPTWYPDHQARGPVLARTLADGPDDPRQILTWSLLGALASARERVRVATPYFLPEEPMVSALNTAALRGVEVELVIPGRTNHRYLDWATYGELERVLGRGVRVWLTPPPFDHTKLMVVDGTWVRFGSTNWDARSLRLNFELDVECWDPVLGARCDALIDDKKQGAREVRLEEVQGRGLPRRLRDGVARLFKPYL